MTAAIRLPQPLHPRPLAPQWRSGSGGRGRTLTLHLHTFVYGRPLSAGPRQQQGGSGSNSSSVSTHTAEGAAAAQLPTPAASASAAAAAAAESAQVAAEASLLGSVVGSDDGLAALPGGPSVAGGMAGPPLARLCFGVLLWGRLPEGLMQWPAWIEAQQYVVSGQRARRCRRQHCLGTHALLAAALPAQPLQQ